MITLLRSHLQNITNLTFQIIYYLLIYAWILKYSLR